jgi:threonine/homoserine/homoserine lactone efflux protein
MPSPTRVDEAFLNAETKEDPMLSFITASLILIMIPGPDQALITRNALARGRSGGLLTMAGGALGLGVHGTFAALGISALLTASAAAFTVLKIAGAAYLIWMGISTLRASRRTTNDTHVDPASATPTHRLRSLRQGFTSNALNPKIALFFVTFLPQFMPGHHATIGQAFLLCAVFAALYLGWFSTYVMLVDWIGAALRRPTVRARIEQVTGFLLVAFAVRLILQHN